MYRYQAVPKQGAAPPVPNVYLPKWLTGNPPPKQITVTVEWED